MGIIISPPLPFLLLLLVINLLATMGNTPSSPLQICLLAAMAGNRSRVAFPSDPFYQATAVHPYNLNIPVQPAAVTYPKISVEVAKIVSCATQMGYKVQARSGGHSYGNYGEETVPL